jgi:hypothetical protein
MRYLTTKNYYYLYSRAGYMNRMSFGNEKKEDFPDLCPPSPRTLRVISRTFALWQDTWYHDRKQIEMKHLS